ncbi:glutathione S-transferase family protein [Thalassomonas actiniarum]|uniref:Glutathione S-transferase family protein n=1 Tax=Thalassomonas actiniarum TaxID=485447 RepID=A0AAE9YLD8_9GAMM|nr:glutathione S-transferase family protein [Thalassomonas actiniarum]WDD97231.1 glutathione S-transferase family protein [Thalassomonas actiniarum]
MGKLIDGEWLTDDKLAELEAKAYQASGGKFERGTAGFRSWVTADGSAGPSGSGGFKAEAGRYHLFAALNCPWAHRTLIYRQVKKLAGVVSLSLVAPLRTENGWVFDNHKARFRDDLYQLNAMYELYLKANPKYSGRVTVPVLWDKQKQTIVSNESSEIIRMFNGAFNPITGDEQDFYPEAQANDIDELNDYIFNHINNGVYKAGFARTQSAYDEAVTALFAALDKLELRLAQQDYLLGDKITEADWRLLPTLVRFDVGYFSAFKCNLKMLRDYPNLSRYLKALYRIPGVAETVDLDIYRSGYHSKSPLRNPHGIVPIGPLADFT